MKPAARNAIDWFLAALLAVRPVLDLWTDAALPLPGARLNPAALAGLATIAAGAVWLVLADPGQRRRVLRHPLLSILALWTAALFPWAAVPVLLHGAERIEGVREWARLFSYVPLAAMALDCAHRRGPSWIVNAILASFALPAVMGLYEIFLQQGDFIKNVHRISGPFVHPNPFSFYLVLIAALAYHQLRHSGWMTRAIAILGLSLFLLAGTFSFTGAGMFGIVCLTAALGEKGLPRRGAVAAVLIFVAVFASTPTGWQRIRDEARVENLDMIERTGKHTTSLTWRLLNWRFLYRTWKRSPWVGHGLASSPRVNPMLNPEGAGSDPHNDYVRYLAETGALGLPLFLAMLGATGWTLWQARRRAPDASARHLALMALALYAAWLVGSVNDNLITATAYQYPLWALFAAASARPWLSEPDEGPP